MQLVLLILLSSIVTCSTTKSPAPKQKLDHSAIDSKILRKMFPESSLPKSIKKFLVEYNILNIENISVIENEILELINIGFTEEDILRLFESNSNLISKAPPSQFIGYLSSFKKLLEENPMILANTDKIEPAQRKDILDNTKNKVAFLTPRELIEIIDGSTHATIALKATNQVSIRISTIYTTNGILQICI